MKTFNKVPVSKTDKKIRLILLSLTLQQKRNYRLMINTLFEINALVFGLPYTLKVRKEIRAQMSIINASILNWIINKNNKKGIALSINKLNTIIESSILPE